MAASRRTAGLPARARGHGQEREQGRSRQRGGGRGSRGHRELDDSAVDFPLRSRRFPLAIPPHPCRRPGRRPPRALARLRGDEAASDVRARYTKYEHRIPMRDGKRLFTAVYVPKDTVEDRTRSCSPARPTASPPTGPTSTASASGPPTQFERGGLHRRLPGRARPLHVGGRVGGDDAPQAEEGRPRRTSTRAPTPGTPSTGW